MQPPEEQYLKNAGMGSEEPLLVLKPSLGKVLLRLVVGVFLIVRFSYRSLPFFQSNWEYISYDEMTKVLYVFWVFICMIVVTDMMFIRNFKLYSDRAEQHYAFWKRTVYLKDARVVIRNYFDIYHCLHITPNGNCFCSFLNAIKYNFNLGNNEVDADSVINFFESVGIRFRKSGVFFCEKYKQVQESVSFIV